MPAIRGLQAVLALLVIMLAEIPALAQTAADPLAGRWELVSQQRIADGEAGQEIPATDKTRGVWIYADGIWRSEGGLGDGSRGTYQWIDPGRIRAVTLASPFPRAVGRDRTIGVEIQGSQLRLTVTYSAHDMQEMAGLSRNGTKYPRKTVLISTLRRIED